MVDSTYLNLVKQVMKTIPFCRPYALAYKDAENVSPVVVCEHDESIVSAKEKLSNAGGNANLIIGDETQMCVLQTVANKELFEAFEEFVGTVNLPAYGMKDFMDWASIKYGVRVFGYAFK